MGGNSCQQFFDLHKTQLERSGIPRLFWEALYLKVSNLRFDAGLDFSLMRVEYEDGDELGWRVVVSNPDGVLVSDPNAIYLIDHAWTYIQSNARTMLSEENGAVAERMGLLMDLDPETPLNELIDQIMIKQWMYNQTYSISTDNNSTSPSTDESIWYILDEFGARIQHSDEPTVKLVPFLDQFTNTFYSLFFPLTDLPTNSEVTRDYMPHIPLDEELERQCRLLPWISCDFTDIEDIQYEPEDEYFTLSRTKDQRVSDFHCPVLPTSNVLIWGSDYISGDCVENPRLKFTDDRTEANIVYQRSHITDFRALAEEGKYMNQFPYENVITDKGLLAIVSRRAASDGHSHPHWLPITYNLNTELAAFISHYQQRAERSADNHWICKPWNLARGKGHIITDNINCLVRLPESGPFIASKYIERPVTFNRPEIGDVKFDYRYMVILKSVKPLVLSCDRRFFIRFSNREFEMTGFDDYEKHFTVHNYTDPDKLLNINCEEFIPLWNQQHPDNTWDNLQTEIMQCILELFQAATSKPAPRGIGESPLSRALYGIDMMLKWDTDSKGRDIMVPQILEVNFSSDIKRACDNYPGWFEEIVQSMYFNSPPNSNGQNPANEHELIIQSPPQ